MIPSLNFPAELFIRASNSDLLGRSIMSVFTYFVSVWLDQGPANSANIEGIMYTMQYIFWFT